MKKNRILHLFQWRLKDIENNLEVISNQGFNMIQISPIQPLKEYTYVWWTLYQPCGFTIGNNWIGSKKDLISLCNKAKKYNIKIIADVICNHTASNNNNKFLPHEKVDKILINRSDFWKEKIEVHDWNNRYEVTHFNMGLPGLNTSNHDLQDIIIKFLNELIECGVRGFRFDAAKHIGLPEEGCDFFIRVLNNLNNKEELFNYAEVIFSDKFIIDNYAKYIKVLTDSYGSNKDTLVTFIESHDTYYEFKYTTKMTDEMITHEYDILTNNFNNTLYFARPFDDFWKSEIIKRINYK